MNKKKTLITICSVMVVVIAVVVIIALNNNGEKDFIFGNKISDGGYIVQTSESLMNTWFSRGGKWGIFNHPSIKRHILM